MPIYLLDPLVAETSGSFYRLELDQLARLRNQPFPIDKIGGQQGIGGLKALGWSLKNLIGKADFFVETVIVLPEN